MSKVIKRFRDKTTKKVYQVGDSYSHKNDERIAFLVGKGYLEKDQEDLESKITHTGGGWYELPNGEKVKGKDQALEALEGDE